LQQAVIDDPSTQKSASRASKPDPDNLVKSTVEDTEADLGVWLASIESFLGTTAHPFADKINARAHDWSAEINLTSTGLVNCSQIIAELRASHHGSGLTVLSGEELDDLSEVVLNALNLSEGLSRAKPLAFAEWRAWCRVAVESFHNCEAFSRIVAHAERAAEMTVPEKLRRLIESDRLPFGDRFDLGVIVPYFARILRWLGVIEGLLLADEPLKPSLLVFARVYEDTNDLVGHINRRLLRFSDEDAELFRALDSASYIA